MGFFHPSIKQFTKIVGELQKKSPQKLSELAKNLNISQRKLMKYLELITIIQNAPEIDFNATEPDQEIHIRKADFTWQLWGKSL